MSTQLPLLISRRTTLVVAIASMFVFLVMLNQHSRPAEVLGRYSTRYALVLGVMLICVTLATVMCALAWTNRLPNPPIKLPSTRPFAWAVVIGSTILTALVWTLLSTGNRAGPLLFRLYISGLVVGAAWVLLRASRTGNLIVSPKFSLYVSLLAVGSALLPAILYIGNVPPSLYMDEPIIVDWSLTAAEGNSYLSAGRMFPTVNLIPQFSVPVLYLTGKWMQLVGAGLVQTTLFYLLIGWASIPFIYLTARRLYGVSAALAALVIAVFIPLMHNYTRPEW